MSKFSQFISLLCSVWRWWSAVHRWVTLQYRDRCAILMKLYKHINYHNHRSPIICSFLTWISLYSIFYLSRPPYCERSSDVLKTLSHRVVHEMWKAPLLSFTCIEFLRVRCYCSWTQKPVTSWMISRSNSTMFWMSWAAHLETCQYFVLAVQRFLRCINC